MISLSRIAGVWIWLALLGLTGRAQHFEFTENKGQWNPAVRFKGELSIGAFFLKDNGYRVVQHHPDDFAHAMEFFTGHHHHTKSGKEVKPLAADRTIGLPGGGNLGEQGPPVRSHAYDVIFEGGAAKTTVLPEKPFPGYVNYFLGNDPAAWVSGLQTFAAVTYAHVYPGIDVRYYSDEGFLKYDVLVAANANPARIVLRYEGASLQKQKNGDVLVKTSVSEVVERAPYAYQWQDGKRVQVACSYVVAGNTLRFRLGDYNPALPLVIDPTLVFSTFSGATTDNWGYTATYDGQGNAYGGGISFGNGWPVTTGAFQQIFGGGGNTGEGTGFDIALMKLSPLGNQRLYSTYLGGSGNEQPHSLVVDGLGNMTVAGRTTSNNYPLINNNRIGPGGSWDIIVTKFNAQGRALIGSAVIGGTGNDGVNIKHKNNAPTGPLSLFQNYGDDARSEVITDRFGNVYVASCTRSDNFPATAGVFQTNLRGDQDALLLKFDQSMNLSFATLLGGDSTDAAYVLNLDDDGSILVAGGTNSRNFPGDKAGTVGPAYVGGIADGFVARINSTGTQVIKSAYIGTEGTDQVYGIQEDRNSFVYIMGTNTGASNSNFPIVNATFRQPGGKQFIAKLRPDFSAYVYATVFGPPVSLPNLSPTAFLVDRCENVYVSGWGGQMGGSTPYPTSGTNNMPLTPDAIDNTTDGKDFYFFVLEKDATRQLYGSYYGQQDPPNSGTPDHVDGGTSRFDPTGVIYQGICANCSPGQFPTTPGVVAPTKPASANCNLAVIKLSFDLSGVVSGIKSSIEGVDGDTSACSPTNVVFRDTVGMAVSYQWLFGDGTPEVTTTQPQVSHNFTREGTYRVRLIAIDLNRCFPRDTSFVNIRVRTDRIAVNANAIKIDPCESNTYRFENLSSVIPSKPFNDSSFTWIFGDNSAPVRAGRTAVTHRFPSPGTYNVQLVLTDTNYCNAPDTFRIVLRVSPTVDANFELPTPVCAPFTGMVNNTTAGGQSFFWDFGNGQTSTAINPVVVYNTPGTYVVRLIAEDPTTCNLRDTLIRTVEVLAKKQAGFTYAPRPSEINIPTTFTNTSEQADRYKWLFGDGDSLVTIRRDTLVRHQYRASGTYNVCLITYFSVGCNDTLCLPVEAQIDPMIDVVTAFTPNRDGVNDVAKVIGFGVTNMVFRIYNRLGNLVFETNDVRAGWDGTYKGKEQPMDVYGYTLEAELLTGDKIRKAGNITLIR